MNVDNQNAETIYNVAGNMHLHSSPEVVELLRKEKQGKLNELYSISFFEVLSKEYAEKNLIERKGEIRKIKEVLKRTSQIMLHGEPGIGKTTSLIQLTNELSNVVYISVKSKSPISVILYLINRIRLSNDEDLLDVKDINEAFEWLQSSLQKSKQCFVIDDCEQDKETVAKLISLEKFDTTFLFASRNKPIFEPTGIKFYPLPPFGEDEVKLFLESHGLTLGTLEFNDIYKASGGNPLYLFYFSKFQISPLPENLVEYQNAIWSSLNHKQQEILSFVSIPFSNVSISEITDVLGYSSSLALSKDIDDLSSLLKTHKGVLEIFHPSFKELIIEILLNKGLLNDFQEKLGIYFLEKSKIVQATFLLIDVAPAKVDKYLYDVFPSLINWGELNFALKVLNAKLSSVKRSIDKGYIYYHLCHVHHLLGNKEDSTFCIDKSLEYFKKAKHGKFYSSALMFKAMNLIECGKVDEAIEIADTVLLETKQDEAKFKAPLLVNLSKIYVDLSEFEKGANACKEAFEIFEAEGNREGKISSLVNLVTCLAHLDEHKSEAEIYGLRLLEIVKTTSEFSTEVIVLNALTSIYREKKEYAKAKDFCSRAIKLCQQYGMKDKVILNMINYGNIFRDTGEFDAAKKIYDEALIKTKEFKLKRDEGRIYWILASFNRKAGNLELSIEFADKSISTNTEINFYYGIANAFGEKSRTLELQNEQIKAAEALVSSADFYKKIDNFSNLYQFNIIKAIRIYNKEGRKELANKLVNTLIESTVREINYGEIVPIILNDSSKEAIASNFEKLFRNYFEHENSSLSILKQFLSFIDYCKGLEESEGKRLFQQVINLILENLGKTKFSFSILGIAIEQSGWLLGQDGLETISNALQQKLELFSERKIADAKIIVSSIAGKINLEIHVFKDELICNKLSIALILILHELPNLIIGNGNFEEKKCHLIVYEYSEEVIKAIGKFSPPNKKLFDENVQTVHMGKSGYDIPEYIFVRPEYEINCDLNAYPDGKGSLYFFATTIMGIKSHFYHSQVSLDKSQRRQILNSLAILFDYSNTEPESTSKSKYEIDLSTIN